MQGGEDGGLFFGGAIVELDDLVGAIDCGITVTASGGLSVLIESFHCCHLIGDDVLQARLPAPPCLTRCGDGIPFVLSETEQGLGWIERVDDLLRRNIERRVRIE